MDERAKKVFYGRNASLSNASRFVDGAERLKYDVAFVKSYIPSGGRVLDLCCGTGMMSFEMKRYADVVYAVDINPMFLEQIPSEAGIVKQVSDAAGYFTQEDDFDVITIFGAMQYNTGDEVINIYDNCYRMLKLGGVLIISGQWGVKQKVTVDKFSEEIQENYFAEYRTTDEEQSTLEKIGFETKVVTILPERFNRFADTHFYGIVAKKKPLAENVPAPKYKKAIGIIGGMGSYATEDFFRRLIDAIPAEKEWDRPHIIIDNKCTMPSRVRAIIYNENYDYVLDCLVDSTRMLLNAGVDILVLACNTSHVFIEDIERKMPQSKGKFVNIIESLGPKLSENVDKSYKLLASEGTIESRVYEKYLAAYGIEIEYPTKEDYSRLRRIIEDVKQNKIGAETKAELVELIKESACHNIIIGCTEFPCVYRTVANEIKALGYSVYDPLETTIEEIKKRLGEN